MCARQIRERKKAHAIFFWACCGREREESDDDLCWQSANESALETMIKDMRRELAACQEQSWRLDEAAELGDMKERVMMSMLPRNETSDGVEQVSVSVASGFADLSILNEEMDEELDALMQQLGSVKNQFSSLDTQRRTLTEELEKEKQALRDAGGNVDAGWQSDSDEEEFYRREAEQQENDARGEGDLDGNGGVISSFIENVSVE